MTDFKKNMIFKTLAVALTAFGLAACGGDKPANTTSSGSTTNAPQESKNIIIATESSFKPFSYLDNTGKLVGFEIDLANALCDEMKVTCDIQSQDWDSLIPSLQANKSDAIMAGMSITPERLQVVDFSDAYFDNKLAIVGKKGEQASLEDLAGKTVGVQQATLSGDYLAQHQPKAIVKSYDKQDNVYLDLSAGRVDYILSDFVPVSDWLKTEAGSNFEIKGALIDINDKVGIAVRKDDALKGEFNTALANLKANGKYDELVAKYFDSQGAANPAENATPSTSAPESAPTDATPAGDDANKADDAKANQKAA